MIVCKTINELTLNLYKYSQEGKNIGFVPTMGALHQGHLSLVIAAKEQSDVVVCSIFVNPTQFNNLNDLKNYPRTVEEDCAMLDRANCDVVFIPEIHEIYSQQELNLKRDNIEDKTWTMGKTVDFGLLDKVMEGAKRAGHFNGVAQVVSKLFRIVKPHKAFFGQKDFQQLAIIRSMVKQMDMKIEIISCPIVREDDGLAMSSRNVLLSKEQRNVVSLISKTLFIVANSSPQKTISELIEMAVNSLSSESLMKLDYFEIVDSETLLPAIDFNKTKGAVACIAVYLGSVRLIDNLILY